MNFLLSIRTVRAAAIPILGRLITECGAKEAREKARLTLETIAREPQGVPPSLAVPLVLTLAAIAPSCPQNYIEDGKIIFYNKFSRLIIYEIA